MKDPVVHCGTGDGRKVKMGCYDDGAYTNKSISKYRSLAFNQRSRKSRKRDAAETVAEVLDHDLCRTDANKTLREFKNHVWFLSTQAQASAGFMFYAGSRVVSFPALSGKKANGSEESG